MFSGRDTETRILVVEDDQVSHIALLALLRSLELKAHSAFTGAEALNHTHVNRYDLILMEINMPEIDGYEAARAIRRFELEAKLAPVPIIALSSNFDVQLCKEAGFTECVQKPVIIQTLRQIISIWLE